MPSPEEDKRETVPDFPMVDRQQEKKWRSFSTNKSILIIVGVIAVLAVIALLLFIGQWIIFSASLPQGDLGTDQFNIQDTDNLIKNGNFD